MFEQLQKSIDIFLIQELWLFDYELTLLTELHAECLGIGKAVDTNDPLSAAHGCGGVAVL